MFPGALPCSFFERDTLQVARDLIGKKLVARTGEGRLAGYIIETEAYCGLEDRASHASRGRTMRNAAMFGPAGRVYVYLVYGMHCCFNVVTEGEETPAAVLVRALEPCEGIQQMKGSNPGLPPERWANGPGKLCRLLHIDRSMNGLDLSNEPLSIEIGRPPGPIEQSKRIGVSYAGAWKDKPWRFFEVGNRCLSR